MSQFEDEVLRLLGEMNQRQIAVGKRLDNIENNLEEVKETTRITRDEVVSLREDLNTMTESTGKIDKEQKYQFTKWAEHDRRISELERKILS